MLAVIGLGNPGREYEHTRHNIGFDVVDAIAERFRVRLKPGRGEFWIGLAPQLILVKPITYMNDSGIAVRELLEQYPLSNEQILIVLDDFHLPLGAIRIRRRGSSGGHNGLSSVIYHLASDDVSRLRVGIKSEVIPQARDAKIDFVLSPFNREEEETVQKAIVAARDAVITAAAEGLDAAISRFNGLQV